MHILMCNTLVMRKLLWNIFKCSAGTLTRKRVRRGPLKVHKSTGANGHQFLPNYPLSLACRRPYTESNFLHTRLVSRTVWLWNVPHVPHTPKCSWGYADSKMVKLPNIYTGPTPKVAKVATENRQNRHMAEFHIISIMKVVEHQILCGKLVSYASNNPPNPK